MNIMRKLIPTFMLLLDTEWNDHWTIDIASYH